MDLGQDLVNVVQDPSRDLHQCRGLSAWVPDAGPLTFEIVKETALVHFKGSQGKEANAV
jgi:hypothetical protein